MLHSHEDDPSSCKEHITLAGTNRDYSSRHVLLSTALVRVTDQSGTPHSASILLDNGSTANFITKDLCESPVQRQSCELFSTHQASQLLRTKWTDSVGCSKKDPWWYSRSNIHHHCCGHSAELTVSYLGETE